MFMSHFSYVPSSYRLCALSYFEIHSHQESFAKVLGMQESDSNLHCFTWTLLINPKQFDGSISL